MSRGTRPLFAFYGDDFTGSTDAVLQFARVGLPGALLIGSPSYEEVKAAAASYPVVGIAGLTRSMPPADIVSTIEPILETLVRINPDFLQYKVCSTADSSPQVGSFAPAIRFGHELTERPVPVLVAQPSLGRYTFFGHHFARYREVMYRLDRQPAMATHPVTPMTESDLTLHLGAQLGEPVGLVSIEDLHRPGQARRRLAEARRKGQRCVVFDTATETDLRHCGEAIIESASGTLAFGVGSGGLSTAVAAAYGFSPSPAQNDLRPAEGLCLALSGSCSPVNSHQIHHALSQGWHGIHLDLSLPMSGSGIESAAQEASRNLAVGRNVVVYTCLDHKSVKEAPIDSAAVGSALALILRHCARLPDVKRIIVAGGDTSGHVISSVGATAIMTRSLFRDALLGYMESTDPNVDGLEVVLKGGQIGSSEFFERVRLGEE